MQEADGPWHEANTGQYANDQTHFLAEETKGHQSQHHTNPQGCNEFKAKCDQSLNRKPFKTYYQKAENARLTDQLKARAFTLSQYRLTITGNTIDPQSAPTKSASIKCQISRWQSQFQAWWQRSWSYGQ